MLGHYVRRFFTSLSTRAPSDEDEAWVERVVSPAELLLFRRLPNTDRRHLVHSARMVEAALGPDADPVWVHAALLHDVGKYDAHLGVFGRVLATVLATVLGTRRVQAWHDRPGWRGRCGRYQLHGETGAAEIRAAGGPEEAAVWSELHHYPEHFADSSIPPEMLTILDAADH
jgi:hypothetical protein